MLCKKCGGELEENALFCRFCGNKIEQETVAIESNKTNEYMTDEDSKEESEPGPSVDYPELFSNNQDTEDAKLKEEDDSDKTDVGKNSKVKYAIISIALVVFVVIIGVVAIASNNKNNDIEQTPDYNYDEPIQSTAEESTYVTENTVFDTYDDINSAYKSLVSDLYSNGDAYYEYMIYDIDQDGVTELIYHKGTCRADMQMICYTFDGERVSRIGVTYGDVVYGINSNRGIYTYYCQTGFEILRKVSKHGNEISEETIYEGMVGDNSLPSDAYSIETFEYSDNSGIDLYARYSDEYVPVLVPDDTNEEKVVIADGGLRIRHLPSVEDGEKVGLIPNGSTIVVEKIADGWAYTTYDGISGWCSCEFLFEPTDYDGQPLYSAVVNPYEGLRLRTEAYINGENIITVIPYAESVQVYEVDGEWAYISYNDIFGWCSTEYLD